MNITTIRKCFPNNYYLLVNLEALVENILYYISNELLDNDYILYMITD